MKIIIGLTMMLLGVGMIFYDGMSREVWDIDVGLWTFYGISIGFFVYMLWDDKF